MTQTNTKTDIQTPADVQHMVDSFYDLVNADELLSPIFNDFAEVDWPIHLPKMYAFWNLLILGISEYSGQPFPPHVNLPATKEHYKRWLALFTKSIDANFEGPNTEMAKAKAANIALTFQYRIGLLED
jgi:hemoglobin